MELLATKVNVRLIPDQDSGILLVVNNGKECELVWGRAALFNEHQMAAIIASSIENDSGPVKLFRLPEGCEVISTRSITNVYQDEPSKTLLVTLPGRSMLFYPVDSVEISRILNQRMQSASNEDDTFVNVFETFSKISRFYYNLGSRLLGSEDTSRRPRSRDGETIRNPWIIERRIELPSTRRRNPVLIEEVTPEMFKMIMFTRGSLVEQQRENWMSLFNVDEVAELSEIGNLSTETTSRIQKDVYRTDRTIQYYYNEIGKMEDDLLKPHLFSLDRILRVFAYENPEIDYVQGLNDILSPILYVMNDERLAYKVFSSVMIKQRRYFSEREQFTKSQLELLSSMIQIVDPHLHDLFSFSHDNSQLFICYRWLLLLFKREFGFYNFPKVLETIFSAPTNHYELFIGLALLQSCREDLFNIGHRFDLTLQYFSEKAGSYDVDKILNLADQLHQYFVNTSRIKSDPRFSQIII